MNRRRTTTVTIVGYLVILLAVVLYILRHTHEPAPAYNVISEHRSQYAMRWISIPTNYALFNTPGQPTNKSYQKKLLGIVDSACPSIAKKLHKLATAYAQHGYHDDAYKAYELAQHLRPSRSG